ncbi:major facilitator superfamily transport protein [Natronomonas pharaonis DSM 2160]|uniref:Major facilitator superfamily transport protein n=1 Tax=Natronomonas pharaonis (strain ATCC 35678 / DSM 2160 / CIP 103997 / JCM 8858 / NBRC 14720 / NCIMB 2260 / Gabara) TaxID=348780 RepID=A0A1U7EXF4_NATPD|nr:MFS transporter [Natronomonas pharaonis]CAI49860.1 major facilitator superfamily transport protein [Natronomonas pharaonis DSM 2160]
MSIRSILRQEATALWGDGKGFALVAVAVGWGLLNGARMVYPVIIPYLQETYGLSLAVAGLLITVLWFFAAIGQLPGGILADRVDERVLMLAGTVVVAGALTLVVTSSSAAVLFFATAVWGLGHSVYPIARITFLSNLYRERVGSALGVTMATGDIGQTILPPVATVLAAGVAWQAGLGFIVPPLLVAGLFVVVTSSSRQPKPTRSESEPQRGMLAALKTLRTPAIGLMTGILFLYMFIWQSFTAFYPTYLTTVKGFAPATASLLFGFFFAVGVVVKPVAGTAYDRLGVRTSLVGVLLPATAGFLLLPLTDNVLFIVGITALISAMLGTGAITQSFLAEVFADDMKGAGLGVVRTLTAALAAGGPVVFGVIGEYGYFDWGYIALGVIMAVVVVLTLWMPKAR